MIDIKNETMRPLSDACKEIEGRPHVSTLHRWRLRGVRGQKLETVLIGGRRFTSLEALDRFIRATTAAADDKRVVPSATARSANVDRELARFNL